MKVRVAMRMFSGRNLNQAREDQGCVHQRDSKCPKTKASAGSLLSVHELVILGNPGGVRFLLETGLTSAHSSQPHGTVAAVVLFLHRTTTQQYKFTGFQLKTYRWNLFGQSEDDEEIMRHEFFNGRFHNTGRQESIVGFNILILDVLTDIKVLPFGACDGLHRYCLNSHC